MRSANRPKTTMMLMIFTMLLALGPIAGFAPDTRRRTASENVTSIVPVSDRLVQNA